MCKAQLKPNRAKNGVLYDLIVMLLGNESVESRRVSLRELGYQDRTIDKHFKIIQRYKANRYMVKDAKSIKIIDLYREIKNKVIGEKYEN